jgi:anti-sigma factor RsiW
MDKISRLSAQQRDDLVAYLDGELDDASVQQIEQVLAQSNVARHEVDMLARTWDLLGTLPQPRASAEFTRKTVSALAVKPPPPPLSQQPWYKATRRTGIFGGWVIGLTLSAWLGFMITASWVPNEADDLIDDLPVVQNFEKYTEAGSVEFLQQLQKIRVFNNDSAAN